MTAKEAKELSLEVWVYLKDHPKITRKLDLPDYIYNKLINLHHSCPLCKYFLKNGFYKPNCELCPLKSCKKYSYWDKWKLAKSNKTRKKYATKIYEAILALDITGLD